MSILDTKYGALVESFKRDILGGKYPPDRPLPSERALIRRYGIARSTVQRALAELERQGLICRRQGRGTFPTKIGASRLIGVVVPGISYSAEYFRRIFSSLAAIAQQNDYSIVLDGVWTDDPARNRAEAEAVAARLIDRKVAGVIYHPIARLEDAVGTNAGTLAALTQANIPVVLVDSDIVEWPDRSDYDLVSIDNVGAGMLLAEHLYAGGAKNLYFLMRNHPIANLHNRIKGVEMMARGLYGRSWSRSHTVRTEEVSHEFVSALMRRGPRPDAIICENGRMACQLIRQLSDFGFRVPEEVQVAGFDDMPYVHSDSTSVTMIRQSCEGIATEAFSRLMARIRTPNLSPIHKVLPYTLVSRASTRHKAEKMRRK